jgi:hypothetical protein
MQSNIPLPGLDRLVETCRRNGLLRMVEPPSAGAPLAGLSTDPVLAAIHARVGCIGIKEGFNLLRLEDEQKFDITRVNEEWRRDWSEPFRSLLVFAKEEALAIYYATVPSLEDETGAQPVVVVNVYEEPYALPIASNVDRFFDVYSRYLDTIVKDPDYEEQGPSVLAFPWGVAELIARDRPLVEMLRAGRFDLLMPKDEETRAWVAQVEGAAV